MIGQGERGLSPMVSGEQCKRDYESDIAKLDDKIRVSNTLLKATKLYCNTAKPDLYRPDSFTFPHLLGHLMLQINQLEHTREYLMEEWERVKSPNP